MQWRKYLEDCLNDDQMTERIRALATRLTSEFLVGIACLLPVISFGNHSRQMLQNELVDRVNSAICIRARLRLSSFRYCFTWIPTSLRFNHLKMKTPTEAAHGSDLDMNEVRYGRSPYVTVRRPEGQNEHARECREFAISEFGPRATVRRADVVCFDGRVQEA